MLPPSHSPSPSHSHSPEYGDRLMSFHQVNGSPTKDVFHTDVTFLEHPTDEELDQFIADECYTCGAEIPRGTGFYLWGRPMGEGTRMVSVIITDSEECMERVLTAFQDEVIKTDMQVNWRIRH